MRSGFHGSERVDVPVDVKDGAPEGAKPKDNARMLPLSSKKPGALLLELPTIWAGEGFLVGVPLSLPF